MAVAVTPAHAPSVRAVGVGALRDAHGVAWARPCGPSVLRAAMPSILLMVIPLRSSDDEGDALRRGTARAEMLGSVPIAPTVTAVGATGRSSSDDGPGGEPGPADALRIARADGRGDRRPDAQRRGQDHLLGARWAQDRPR